MVSKKTQAPLSNDRQSLAVIKENAIYIVMVIVVALASYFGWNYYHNKSVYVDTVAADVFTDIERRSFEIETSLANPNLDESARLALETQQNEVNASIESLVKEHGDTIYAWQALLLQARQFVDNDNYPDAAKALKKALTIDLQDSGLHALTQLRYATVLLGAQDIDNALQQASVEVPNAFEATKQELLGDIYRAKNDKQKAVRAYENAWSLLLKREQERAILKLKMESLGLTPEPMPNRPSLIAQSSSLLEQDNLALLKQAASSVDNSIDANKVDETAPNIDLDNLDKQDHSSSTIK